MISSVFPVVILGFVGWVLAILFIYRCIKTEQEKNYKAIHLSAIKDGRVGRLFKSGIIEGMPVVSEKAVKRVSQYLESDEIPEGVKDDLRVLNELDLKIMKGNFSDICKILNCPAITAGKDKDELKVQGIDCINIKDLDSIGKSNIVKGERICVNYMDYGYDTARGYLRDGTLVEIKGEIPKNQPVSLECIVEAIIESRFNRKVWAKFAEND